MQLWICSHKIWVYFHKRCKMLTKVPVQIMQLFASSITKSLKPVDVSKALGMDYKHVHVTLKSLAGKKFLEEVNGLYKLNYAANHQVLAYVEHLRSEEFLKKKKNAYVKLVVQDILERIREPSFIFLLFGSRAAGSSKASDVDLMVIMDSESKAKKVQKELSMVKSPLKLDIRVYWYESAYEMLQQPEKKSVLHQTFDKHILFHGAESYYRLIARGGR